MNYLKSAYVLIFTLLTLSLVTSAQQTHDRSKPFLGWNSYDSYGLDINEEYTKKNLDAFIAKLKPSGYEYFVLDAGWFQHYDLKPGEEWATDGDKSHLRIDEYARFIPSEVLFPNGFKEITDHAHNHNVKFGLHVMRGIPREAVKKNLAIKGTKYRAQDIADTTDICSWSSLMYGVDMDKPGAQEYYNSVVELLAGWGVDFIKYDDIVHKPREIEAVLIAIENSGRDIILSISPGKEINPEYVDTYSKTDMVRISGDIWDFQEDIDISFERWDSIIPYAGQGFWLDLDMIPFGHIRIDYPRTHNLLKSNRGYERMDYFTTAQKETFMTQRAMAASPLFMGGALTTSPASVFEIITNPDMLECNQNGVAGELHMRIDTYADKIDVWKTEKKDTEGAGWLGIFNRNPYWDFIKMQKSEIGLDETADYHLYDIWRKQIIEDKDAFVFEIPPNGVIFIKYKKK